jgi:FkbM family methyltransferase
MKISLKKIKGVLKKIMSYMIDIHARKSYSQEGEDLILARVFEQVERGFYVDVGALDPKRFSNTHLFYQKGWSGINIDATPGSMEQFKHIRPRDINLEIAISATKKTMTFFVFNESALNSFDRELSKSRNKGNYHIQEEIQISTQTLKEVLAKYASPKQKISFLSVDVEGLDLEVIQSNDWNQFRPEYVLIECLDLDFKQITENSVYQFMCEHGYTFFAKTVYTVIFKDIMHSC